MVRRSRGPEAPAAATSLDRTGPAVDHTRTRPWTLHCSSEVRVEVRGLTEGGRPFPEPWRGHRPPSRLGQSDQEFSLVGADPVLPHRPTDLGHGPPDAVDAEGEGMRTRAGIRAGRPRRAGALRGRALSSAQTVRRPTAGSHAAWRTITVAYCPVRVTLPKSHPSRRTPRWPEHQGAGIPPAGSLLAGIPTFLTDWLDESVRSLGWDEETAGKR